MGANCQKTISHENPAVLSFAYIHQGEVCEPKNGWSYPELDKGK
jgi:hypothetical protein